MNDKENLKSKKYANLENEWEEWSSIISQRLTFTSLDAAKKCIQKIRENYIVSNDDTIDNDMAVKLWIRGFEVTKEEKQAGYLGNYGVVLIKRPYEGRFTPYLEKVKTNLRHHPRRHRHSKNKEMPNWGHPILRKLKDNPIYKTFDDAWFPLQELREEYPKTTILGNRRLFMMIFSRMEKPEVKRYVFEVQESGKGFSIKISENTHQNIKIQEKVDETSETLNFYLFH
jgi:hypothetical protein